MTTTLHPVAASMRAILSELSDEFLERRSVIEAAIIAILAREHLFMLGPPGTGKSALVRALIQRIAGARHFEVLLSKTRPDAAVLGQYDLPLLQSQGVFRRRDAGYLTDCEYALLDEGGKMSPTLGHDMLPILNERLKHEVDDTGRSAAPIPLMSAFVPSNELIAHESEDAAALWDRLLLRVYVDYIQEPGNFAALLQSKVAGFGRAGGGTTVDLSALQQVTTDVIPAIPVTSGTFATIQTLKDKLEADGIVVSTRRWGQTVRLLQASAFFNGRSQVEDDDLQVLRFALWDEPSQMSTIERTVLSLSNPDAEKCMDLLDGIEAIAAAIRDKKGESLQARTAYGTEANGKLRLAQQDAQALREDALRNDRSTTKIDEVIDRVAAVRRTLMVEMLEFAG